MSPPPSPDDLDALADIYPHGPGQLHIVRSQIEQRAQLVKTWDIKPGERILEIGCGQGDCTLVLAAAAGDAGSVTAIDPASLDYGMHAMLRPIASLLSEFRQDLRLRWDKRRRI